VRRLAYAIYNTNTVRPGIAVGTLDESHVIDVVAHVRTTRKQARLIVPDDTPHRPRARSPVNSRPPSIDACFKDR
jgi:hypothetical protein